MGKEKLGILGGTFNPIHYGHLLLAESARDRLGLEQVLFIPTGNNPTKVSDNEIDSIHRYNMTKLAIASNPYFKLSTIDMERSGYTYTIDTITALEEIYEDSDFYFIFGADIIFEIESWKEAETVLKKLKIVTTFRPGYNEDSLDKRIEELKENYGAKIMKLYTPEMNISSSEIRSRVKRGYSIKYLLPEVVEEYIKENNLYL